MTNNLVKFQGLTIKIETPNGSIRKGKDRVTGKSWSTEMSCDYGEILNSKGMDGDEVDVFLGKFPGAKFAFVVHQLNPNTGEFDEDKVFLGFLDSKQAKDCYFRHYDNPKKFFGGISAVPMAEFKQRLLNRPGKQIAAMSKLMSTIALHACGCTAKPGDQVVVDGLRGRGQVVSRQGKRLTVRYADGTTLSRDDRYVHPMTENDYKSKFSSLRAGEEMVERENGPVDRSRPGGMYIVKSGSLFCVRSRNQADKDFGCYNSREEAQNAMNGRAFNGLEAYGTSEGVKKEWDSRGSGLRKMVKKFSPSGLADELGEEIKNANPDAWHEFRDYKKEDDQKAASQFGNAGWQYGRSVARKAGFIPQRSLAGFPTSPSVKKVSLKVPKMAGPGRGAHGPQFGRRLPTMKVKQTPASPKVPNARVTTPKPAITRPANNSSPTGSGFGVRRTLESEGVTGSMGNAHIDPVVWFHPPSLSSRNSNESLRVPTDDPREKNDKFGDVTKRNSKDTKEQRMKILKRSGTGAITSVPAQTTLLQHQTGANFTSGMTGLYASRKSKRTGGKARQFTSYARRGVI